MAFDRLPEVLAFVDTLDALDPGQEAAALDRLRHADPELYGYVAELLDRSEGTASRLPKSPVRAAGDQEDAAQLPLGAVLHDKYEVIRPLGEGGMGSVLLARDLDHRPGDGGPGDRLVAIKVADAGARAHLKKEALLLESLRHPHLPRVEATFRERGRRCVAMEYIEGDSLEARLREDGPVSVETAWEWLRDVLRVLEYLHDPPRPRGEGRGGRRGPYVHRDIKPANVLIQREGGLYVVDLGIAQTGTAGLSALAPSREGRGTLEYAAPEVWAGERAVPQSDLYSTGMLAFALLTGEPMGPFASIERDRGLDRTGLDPFARALAAAPLDASVRDWIRTATALEISDRYETAAAMSRALDEAVFGRHRPSSSPASWWRRWVASWRGGAS